MGSFMFGGGGGAGSADASSGKGISGTNKNPDTTLFCGNSTICYRTVVVQGVTKDSDTTATIQLDYKSSKKVSGYQFVIEFDSSLTLTSPSFNISERTGSQPGFTISSAQSISTNRFLIFGFFSSAGTFLPAVGADTDFLTVEITTSNNAFAGLSSSDVTNKTNIVYSNDNINSPSSPNPVFAAAGTNSIKNDSWTGYGTDGEFDTFTDELADIYQSGLTFDATNWSKSKDTRLKGYYDITDLCSHKLFRIDGSKVLFDYVCEEQMLSDSDCTVCESPKDIATTSACDSEICILSSITSANGKEAVITFGYKSTCRISGYEITLGGLKSRTAFDGIGGALRILQSGDQEAHKKQWLENLGRNPALSNSDRLAYNAPDEKINTRIFGFSFGRLLHEDNDGTLDLGDFNSSTTAWSLPSTGGKFKKLTRVVVNLESFSSVPVLSSFKMVTSETLKAPVNDYSNNWTAIDLNGFLGSVSHSTVGVKDLMACLYYYREGFGGAETSPYDSLNAFTQKFISEAGRSELAISDVLAVGNHITLKGLDVASDNTALIVPSDCCSITLPGDFTLSGTFIACDQVTNPGKVSLAIGQSTSATGYNVYRKTRVISESYKTPDSALANKLVRKGIVRTEDLYRTKLELITTLSTHQTYIDLPSVPVRDCSINHDATYYVIAFNSAGEVAKEVTVSYKCCDEEGAVITTPDVSLTRVMNSEVEIFLPVTFNGAPAFFGSATPETGKPVKALLTSSPSKGGAVDLSFADEGKFIYRPPADLLGKVEFTYTARAMSLPGSGPNLDIENPGIIEMTFIPPPANFTVTPLGCGESNSGKVLINLENETGSIAETSWIIERKLSTDSGYSQIKKINSTDHEGEETILYIDEPGISECCNNDVAYDYKITATSIDNSNTAVSSEPVVIQATVQCCALENVTNLSTSTTNCADGNHPEVTVTWTATNTTTSGKTVKHYIIYRKPSPTGGPYEKVGVTDALTFTDNSLPNVAEFNTNSSYKYAVVTIAKDSSISGDPNHANWAVGTAGDSCSQGGSESTVAVPNCSKAPCPQSETVEVCAGETALTVNLNFGCIIKGQEVGIVFAETSGGTAAAGLVTIDPSTGVATIDTTGVPVGSYTQNFTVTDSLTQSGSGVLTVVVVDCDCGCHNSDATYTICDFDKDNNDWTSTSGQVPFSVPQRPNPRGPTSPESHPPVVTQEDGDAPTSLPEAPAPEEGGGGSGGGGTCSDISMYISALDATGLSNVDGGTSSLKFTVVGVGSEACAKKYYNLLTPHVMQSTNFQGYYYTGDGDLTTTWNSDYDEMTISWVNNGTPSGHGVGQFQYINILWGHQLTSYSAMTWSMKLDGVTKELITTGMLGNSIANSKAYISPPYAVAATGFSAYNNFNTWATGTQGSATRYFRGPKFTFESLDNSYQNQQRNQPQQSAETYTKGFVTMTIGGTDYYSLTHFLDTIDTPFDSSHRLHSEVTTGRTLYSPSNVTKRFVRMDPSRVNGTSSFALGYYGKDDAGTVQSTTSSQPDASTNCTFYFPADQHSSAFGGSLSTHVDSRYDLKIVVAMNDRTAGNITMTAFRSDSSLSTPSWTQVDRIYYSGHNPS